MPGHPYASTASRRDALANHRKVYCPRFAYVRDFVGLDREIIDMRDYCMIAQPFKQSGNDVAKLDKIVASGTLTAGESVQALGVRDEFFVGHHSLTRSS